MFREMRRKDRALEKDVTIEFLKNCEYGILSTVCEDGYPYGVPISFVYFDNSIYFHGAAKGQKFDNILKNSKVSFCTVGATAVQPDKFTTKYKSVIVFGKAEEVFDDEKNAALLEVLKKYSKGYMEKGKEYIKNAGNQTRVMKIKIEHISGKTGIN